MGTVLTTPTAEELAAFTPQQLAACASRELAMRKRVYPYWVDKAKMTKAQAQAELAMMTAIVDLLDGRAQGRLF